MYVDAKCALRHVRILGHYTNVRQIASTDNIDCAMHVHNTTQTGYSVYAVSRCIVRSIRMVTGHIEMTHSGAVCTVMYTAVTTAYYNTGAVLRLCAKRAVHNTNLMRHVTNAIALVNRVNCKPSFVPNITANALCVRAVWKR